MTTDTTLYEPNRQSRPDMNLRPEPGPGERSSKRTPNDDEGSSKSTPNNDEGSSERTPLDDEGPSKRIRLDDGTHQGNRETIYTPRPMPWIAPLCEMDLTALPPLLPLSDKRLALQANTHRSWFEEDESRGLRDHVRWERECFKNLEFIGDAFLHSEIALMLDDLYPNMNTGGKEVSLAYLCGTCLEPAWLTFSSMDLQETRSILTTNVTCAYICRHYGLTHDLRMG